MNEAFQILFSKYLNNEFSQEEKRTFENRLSEDSEFRSEFDIYKSMMGFIDKKNKHGEALNTLRDFHKSSHIPEAPNPIPSKVNWKYIITSLAFFGAAFLAYKYLNKKNPVEVYAMAYVAPRSPGVRGDESSLAAAIAAYDNAQKTEAFDSLYNSKNIKPSDKQYWLAELYLMENKPDSTLKYIKIVNEQVLRDRIIYLECLSYYHKEDYNQVTKLLSRLPDDMSDYYRDRLMLLK